MSEKPAADLTTAAAGARYRAVADADLVWHDCGGEFAAYHRPSGKTHFLNPPSARLLRAVLVEASTADAAAVRLAAEQGGEADARYRGEVGALLERLQELGLIERETP